MNRKMFKSLLESFRDEQDFDKKVEVILASDYRELTDVQIDKLLSTLNSREEITRFIHASEKVSGVEVLKKKN